MCHVQPTYVFVQPLERWRLFQVSADPKQTKNFHQESISLTQTAHSKGESPVTTGAGGHCRAAGGGGGRPPGAFCVLGRHVAPPTPAARQGEAARRACGRCLGLGAGWESWGLTEFHLRAQGQAFVNVRRFLWIVENNSRVSSGAVRTGRFGVRKWGSKTRDSPRIEDTGIL